MLFFDLHDAEIIEERDGEITSATIDALLKVIHEFNPELVL